MKNPFTQNGTWKSESEPISAQNRSKFLDAATTVAESIWSKYPPVSIPSRNAHAGIAPPPPFHVCIPMGIITVTIKTIVINVLVLKSQSNKIFRQNPWNGFDHLGKARIAQQPPSLGCIPTNIIESMELTWFNYSPGKSLVHFFYNECFEHKEPLYDLYALDSSGIQNI